MTEQTFPNTFAPNIRNKEMAIWQIRTGIKLSFIDIEQVPPEILKLDSRNRI
jgi:hypothetical protein